MSSWIVIWNGVAYGPFATEQWAREWIESRGVNEPRYTVGQLLTPIPAEDVERAREFVREQGWHEVEVETNSPASVSAGAAQVPADTIEKARCVVRAWERLGQCEDEFGLCSECCGEHAEHLDSAIVSLKAALAAVRTPEGQVPADTIEVARNAIERFVLCSDSRLRDGMSPDQWLAYQGLLAALAALRTPEEQT